MRAGRGAGVILLAGVAHLALLWLWCPRVAVPAPARHRLAAGEAPASAPSSPPEATVVIGGDTAPTDAASPYLARFGYEYPFSATLDLLRAADLAVVNLEAAVTRRTAPFPLYKRYVYRVDPDALEALSWAGVDAVTLANNHVLDYGREGLLDTLRWLERTEIVGVGAGRTEAEARRGTVFDLGAVRVGILAYMQDTFMHSLYVRSFAAGPSPGCARLTAGHVARDLARMRERADVVVVIVHWGRNYQDVTWSQRRQGRMLIDSGADVVIGHHPHIHQPVGMHRGRPIIYSVGNYAFGTPGRAWFRHALLARLHIRGRRLQRVELVPLLVQNRIVRFKPERLEGAAAGAMLRELAARSRPLGARVEVVGDIAVVPVSGGRGPSR